MRGILAAVRVYVVAFVGARFNAASEVLRLEQIQSWKNFEAAPDERPLLFSGESFHHGYDVS